MKLTDSSGLSTEAGTVRAKSPSMPVVVPTVVPLIRTVAPDHILLILHQLNPFKSIIFIIQLIKCRMSKIHIIEVFDKYFQFLWHIFIRCHHLASRMKHHISISLSDLRILLFFTSRQLIREILQCTNIPAAKRQNIMFAVCIEHGHSQLIMVILSLNRILAQIFKQIFCPSATPLIVKSQMVILHTVCQLRSVLTGQRLPKIYETIDAVIENNSMRVATGVLNEIVTEAVAMQQPPSDKGKRLKIYYVTQVAVKPPTFVIFVNDKELMHFSYTRYLENRIRDAFGFEGTSLKFIIRERKDD